VVRAWSLGPEGVGTRVPGRKGLVRRGPGGGRGGRGVRGMRWALDPGR